MVDFANYHLQFKEIDKIWYNLIADWGHLDNSFGKGTYDDKAIWKKEHPENAKFIELLNNPVFSNSRIDLGNANTFRNKQ
jgi:hypothetical protein